MRVSYMVLVLAVAAMGTGGCKKIAGMAGDAVQGNSNDPAKSSAAIDAMSNYAKGFNAIIDRPQGVIKSYFRTIPDSGPEEDKKYSLGSDHVFADSKLQEAKKAFAEAAKTAPDSLKHLEPLATAVVTDTEKMVATFKTAHDYYQAEDFKDDKGAKGKTLHAEFLKLSESFRTDIGKFENALTEIENKQADEELKQHADKASYSHQFRFFNRQANKLINAKPENFAAVYPEVESAHTALTTFAKEKGAAQPAFKSYADAADRFFADAKRMKREVDAKAKEEQLDSIRDSLTSNYNSLISISNSLRDLEANNLLK